MKYLVVFISLLFASIAIAQKPKPLYQDRSGRIVDKDDPSAYYYTWAEDGLLFSRYAATDSIRFKTEKSYDMKGYSLRTNFHPNGAKASVVVLDGTKSVGLVKTYYPDGKPHSEVDFGMVEDQRLPDYHVLVVSYWDREGVKQVVDGNGHCSCEAIPNFDANWTAEGTLKDGIRQGQWTGISSNGAVYTEQYENGNLVSGAMTSEGRTYTYTAIDVPAEPDGGMDKFNQMMAREMKYPRVARSKGIIGKVYLEFMIGLDGQITDVQVVKGLYPACDEVAVEAIRKAPPWKPAYHRGKAIREVRLLPFTFVP